MEETSRLRERLKTLIVESLNLEGITPDMIEDEASLFNEGLGLDSVDALELVVTLEKEFDIRIEGDDATRTAFASVASLADFVGQALRSGDAEQ